MNRKQIFNTTAPLSQRHAIRRWQRQLLLSLAGVALALALANSPAQAAAITVDGATCTLVDAITAANTDTATGGCSAGNGADTLTLTNDITLTAVNNGLNGLPLINTTITVEGDGHTIKRDAGAPVFRLMEVAAAGDLTINQATLSGGSLIIFDRGGAISSAGTLRINNSTLVDNHAGIAGALTASGVTTITNSTISGNSSITFGAGGLDNSGTMTLVNTTVTRNTAANLGGGFDNGGTITLNRSIISGNFAGSWREFRNGGTVNADNYNLFGYGGDDGSQGSFTPGGTDIVPTVTLTSILNPILGNNGGSSFTHALVAGSPAIDAATDSSLTMDQRGVTRPQGAADDIGAFEAPTLLALATDIGSLTPSFDPNTTSYTATVSNTISSISISPTVSEINASTVITVTPPGGGTPITCTGNPVSCPLAVGDNVVEVHVTSPDGTIVRTYTITITRALSPDATLSALTIGVGNLTPIFDTNITTYTAMVSNTTSSVSITPTVSEINATFVVTVTPPGGGAPITCTGSPIDCPLAIGDNIITVTVTAPDGTVKTYTTIITRPSTDATLSALTIGTGDLTPSFDPNSTNYTATVGSATDSISLTATTNEGNASTVVTVTPPGGGAPITCTGNPIDCPLAEGDNVIEVTVTAQDGTIKTYTITITRIPLDTDGDGIPNSIDQDDDGDGIPDSVEGNGAVDTDNDGIPDSLDLDSDNDGINDVREVRLTDADGDGKADGAINANGIIAVPANSPIDTDGDGTPDYRDTNNNDGPLGDLDGDGLTNAKEGGREIDTDGDGVPNYLDADDNGNGILTKDEDANHDGNLDNDDSNGNGIPDYLDLVGQAHKYWFPIVGKTTK